MHDALRDGVKAGLLFKRTVLEELRGQKLDPKIDLQRAMLQDVADRGTVLVIDNRILGFYGEGERIVRDSGPRLPLVPSVVVPVSDDDLCPYVMLWDESDDSYGCTVAMIGTDGHWNGHAASRVVYMFPKDGSQSRFAPSASYDAENPDHVEDMQFILDNFAWNFLCCATGALAAGAIQDSRPRALSIDRTRQKARGAGVSGVDYRVCGIDPTKRPKTDPAGSTHAAPRWHLRRGHYRTLRTGKSVFVRQCEVGSKERGAVLKDYVMGAAA